MSEQKITQAAEATDAIQRHVGQAIKVLTDSFYGRIINGWGVYSDVSSQRRKLKEAIKALAEAEKAMNGTEWPSRSDYPEE
jgi:hypothetical protein